MPSRGAADLSARARFVKGIMVEYLALMLPNKPLVAFAQACKSGSKDDLLIAFETLRSCVEAKEANDVSNSILNSMDETKRDFESSYSRSPENIKNYLPNPDRTRKGKSISILPHVSSMSHIYARINEFHQKGLNNVRIFHDDQTQFDEALIEAMKLIDQGTLLPEANSSIANFSIDTPVKIQFSSSTNEGIQVADILAGSMFHCMTAIIGQRESLHEGWINVLQDLAELDSKLFGSGLNFVTPNLVKDHFDKMTASCRPIQ